MLIVRLKSRSGGVYLPSKEQRRGQLTCSLPCRERSFLILTKTLSSKLKRTRSSGSSTPDWKHCGVQHHTRINAPRNQSAETAGYKQEKEHSYFISTEEKKGRIRHSHNCFFRLCRSTWTFCSRSRRSEAATFSPQTLRPLRRAPFVRLPAQLWASSPPTLWNK